jgi:putative membrane fusion protein
VSRSTEANSVSPGDFLYKVVDGENWYLILPVNEEQLSSFRIGSNIEVLLDDGTVLKAEAERVLGSDKLSVMAKVLSYYPDFCKVRTLQARVSTKQTKGLEIPVTAVAYRDGKAGVFVLGTDGEYHFTRVEILDRNEESYAVSEDRFTELQDDGTEKVIQSVSLYDEILRDVGEQDQK